MPSQPWLPWWHLSFPINLGAERFPHPAQVGRIGLGLGLSRSMEHPLLLDRRWIRRIRSRHRTRGGGWGWWFPGGERAEKTRFSIHNKYLEVVLGVIFLGKKNPRIELDTYSDSVFWSRKFWLSFCWLIFYVKNPHGSQIGAGAPSLWNIHHSSKATIHLPRWSGREVVLHVFQPCRSMPFR